MLAAEAEQLGPDDHVMSAERQLEPRRVGVEAVERQVAGAGRLQGLDAILDDRVLAVQRFERGDVRIGLVGDEALKTVTVEVGERQLRARVRSLAPADQSRPVGPVGQVDLTGQVGHPRPVARLAVLVDGWLPRRFGQGDQGLSDGFGERVAEREPDLALAAGIGEIVAGPGRIRTREDLPSSALGGNCSNARSSSAR